MGPLLNIATSQSKGDGSFRIVIKNKEPYAASLRSPQKHSPLQKKELCEKPESITRSIQRDKRKIWDNLLGKDRKVAKMGKLSCL